MYEHFILLYSYGFCFKTHFVQRLMKLSKTVRLGEKSLPPRSGLTQNTA